MEVAAKLVVQERGSDPEVNPLRPRTAGMLVAVALQKTIAAMVLPAALVIILIKKYFVYDLSCFLLHWILLIGLFFADCQSFCSELTSSQLQGCCSSSHQCGNGVGHCSSDSECSGDRLCANIINTECSGIYSSFESSIDCCCKLKCIIF